MLKTNCLKLSKNIFILLGVIVSVFSFSMLSNAYASSVNTINLQGKIVRNDTGYEGLNVTTGNPSCVVSGSGNDTCDFRIRYYSASSGGTLFLTEVFSNKEIGQYNGVFNLSLGSTTPTAGSYSTFDQMIASEDDIYVEIGFDPAGGNSYTETFSRMPLQASAFAIRSKYSSHASTAFQFHTAANSSGYSSPSAGMVYFDTTDSVLKVYDGASWANIGSGGSGGSLFTDSGLFTYLTDTADHFVLGSNSYTAIGSDSYATYVAGLASRTPFSFDMGAERLTLSGDKSNSGLTVYSNYTSTGAWPLVLFKAEDSGFDNVVLEIVQDGTGNLMSLKKGSTEVFAFENAMTFFMRPRDTAPTVYENRLYNVGGTLYWNGSAVGGGGGSSLWTDAGAYTYLTDTDDNLIVGGNSSGNAVFYFDVANGRLGIGTGSPTSTLDIGGTSSLISNSSGDITLSANESVVIKAQGSSSNLQEWQNSSGTILGLINQNGYATFGSSTGSSSAILSLGSSSSSVAQINLTSSSGVDVSSPNTGDLWWNGTNLFFFDGTSNVDLLSGGAGALYSENGLVDHEGYLNVQHDDDTYNVLADGWVCIGGSNNETCNGGNWKNIKDIGTTIGHYLSNVWSKADEDGVIRTDTRLSNLELAQGVDVGTGSDGDVTVPTGTTADLNTGRLISSRSAACPDAPNYNITAFNSAGTEATVTPAPDTANGCLGAGDEVLIINLQGISSAYNNVGNYETLEVASVNGSTVTFKTAKIKYYGNNANDDTNLGTTISTQRVMMQRVPNYNNVTIETSGTMTISGWNGVKGGVLYFRARGYVSVGGSIDVTGKGYLGGIGQTAYDYPVPSGECLYTAPAGNKEGYGAEAVASTTINGYNGTYSGGGGGSKYTTNAGGNGGSGNSSTPSCGGGGGGATTRYDSSTGHGYAGGGGGGGYATPGYGGTGQSTPYNGQDGTETSSGAGGAAIRSTHNFGGGGGGGASNYGSAELSKVYFGGGGGAGGSGQVYGSTQYAGGSGGNGGGIILLSIGEASVSGSVKSDGGFGNYGATGSSTDGGGGAGAGGSIRIESKVLNMGSNLVSASGGQVSAVADTRSPGGLGGNGRVAVYYGTLSGQSTPLSTDANINYYSYGVYHSPIINTPNAQTYGNIRWDQDLDTYGKIGIQTRSGSYELGEEIWGVRDSLFQDMNITNSTCDLREVAIQSDGKIIVVGGCSSFNGYASNKIARLNTDGTIDTSFDTGIGANSMIEAIAIQSDGKIVIGGSFTTYNWVSRSRIARLNTDGSLDTDFSPGSGADNTVKDIKIHSDGKIVIAGSFTSYNGTTRNRVARLNSNGSLDTAFNSSTGASSTVNAVLVQSDGKVIIGGEFTTYNGTARNRIARINTDGTLDTGFDSSTGANNTIYVLALQSDGKVLMGGDFTSYNGTSINRIARTNTNGSIDSGFNPGTGASSSVRAIEIQTDGKVLLGGDFTTYNSTARARTARANSDGSLDTGFVSSVSSTVYSLGILGDGKILLAGAFSSNNSVTRYCVSKVNADGSIDTSFDAGYLSYFGSVYGIVQQSDGKIIIVGNFTHYNGTARNRIARINSDGSLDTGFDSSTGANGIIWAVSLQSDGKIIIGGAFSTYNGVSRSKIARLNNDGSLDTAFNPGTGADGTVYAVGVQADGKVLIGGTITTYNGTARNRFARINTDGTLDTGFTYSTGANSGLYAIALQSDGKILIGGDFTTYNGTSINRIARLNTDGSIDSGFTPGTGASSVVEEIVIGGDGKIYIAGGFTSYNGTSRARIAKLNSNGTLDTSFAPGTGANNYIRGLALQGDGKIIIVGDFNAYNGTTINRIVRINTDGTLDTSFDPGEGCESTAYAVALQSDGKILVGGDIIAYDGNSSYYALLRITSTQTGGYTWEEWRPFNNVFNYMMLDSADTHTTWVGTNATIEEGDVNRSVEFFEDENDDYPENITKITSSTSGGYAESTISSTDISEYDYITFWVRASQSGNSLRFSFGEADGSEQYEDITIDASNTWQKVYWDISDVSSSGRNGITKLRITNLSSSSNTIYLDNVRVEKLLTNNNGAEITSTPNDYFQYRVVFTTTDLAYRPRLENISFTYNAGYRIVVHDNNNVRLYNYTGSSKYLKLDVATADVTGSGGSGNGFVNGVAVSPMPDGTNAVAFRFNTSETYSDPSSKLLSVMNNSVEKMYLDAEGNLYVAGTITAGRGFSVGLINNSGSTLAKRSLVTIDPTQSNSITTTNIQNQMGAFGVIQGVDVNNDLDSDGNCDDGDTCLVVMEGLVDVNVDNGSSAQQGDYVYSSTTYGKGTTQGEHNGNGMIGVVTSNSNGGSGYVQMVFNAQNKVTANLYLNVGFDKNAYRDMYTLLAKDYSAMNMAERRGVIENNQSETIMFDSLEDGLKINSEESDVGLDQTSKKMGLWGGLSLTDSTTDSDGNRYFGASGATPLDANYYYDRTQSGAIGQDATISEQIDLGIDPYWYNGVSYVSNCGTNCRATTNLTENYNGNLFKVTGTYGASSDHGNIDITIVSNTVSGITANIVSGDGSCSVSGANLTFGKEYAFTAGSCSGSSIKITPQRYNYKVGDIFRVSSWYVEIPSATRGSRRDFPERSLILSSRTSDAIYVTVIDYDTQKVWMKFVSESVGVNILSADILINNADRNINKTYFKNGNMFIDFDNVNSNTDAVIVGFSRDDAWTVNGIIWYKFDSYISNRFTGDGIGYTATQNDYNFDFGEGFWSKYNNGSILTASDSISTDGRITVGSSGKGDSNGAAYPSVVKDGDLYRMWYGGYDGTNWRIYHATSSDGYTWFKNDNSIPSASNTTGTNGRLPLGAAGTGDVGNISEATVIKDGNTYKMWYTGYDGANSRIYYATSPDGLTWTKYDNTAPARSDTSSTNGRIPLGNSGRGDYSGVSAPAVIKDGNTYKMWYTGQDSGGSRRIYYATSSDGLTWNKYNNITPSNSDTSSTDGRVSLGTSGKGDSTRVYSATVVREGTLFKMWYSGYDGSKARFYYATSSDGLTWTKYDNYLPSYTSNYYSTGGKLVLGNDTSGDDGNVLKPSIVRNGLEYKMWYSGYDGSTWRVFLAKSMPKSGPNGYLGLDYPVFQSSTIKGIDSNAEDTTGIYLSNPVTFKNNSNKAYLWFDAYTDSVDTSADITVSVSNDNGDTYVEGTLIRESGSTIKEYEYSFDFDNSDNQYIVKFELERGSSKKSTVFITGWGLAQMDLSSANGNGLFSQQEDSVVLGDYVEVVHGQNTYNLVAKGWVFDTSLSRWVEVSNTDTTIKHSMSEEWEKANPSGIIRSMIRLTDVSLAPGIDVGTGADGDILIASNTNINRTNLISGRVCADGGDAVNYNITAFNPAGTEATLNRAPSSGCLNVGDEVLVINLQGTSTLYSNTGNYETLEISNVNGATITFKNPKVNYYGDGATNDNNLGTLSTNQKVMLQRVPNYRNVVVNNSFNFYPDAWGSESTENASYREGKGGVMFFRASGNVVVNGTIHANALGFRGGAGGPGGANAVRDPGGYLGESYNGTNLGVGGGSVSTNATNGGGNATREVATSPNNGYVTGGGGGGGASGYTTSVDETGGAGGGGGYAGGGGGGGAGRNGVSGTLGGLGGDTGVYAGGGAGATTTGTVGVTGDGGNAGYPGLPGATGSPGGEAGSYNISGSGGSGVNSNGDFGGAGGGGGGLYGVADLRKIYFGSGGGGGGGGSSASTGTGITGASGGGIVAVSASNLSISGAIQSRGGTAADATGISAGAGGGGAGGSILLQGKNLDIADSKVSAVGGLGSQKSAGPAGGGGGVGRIAVSYSKTFSGYSTPILYSTISGYYSYGIYTSPEISTPSANGYGNMRWEENLNTYGKISVQTRTGNSPDSTDGTWEEWRPSSDGTNYLTLENADTHTNWNDINSSASEGDILRNVDYFEDEDEMDQTKITKMTTTTNGGYIESTFSSKDLSNYDYITAWVRSNRAGNTLRMGMGESTGNEQYDDITIDNTDTWQKVYWNISDVETSSKDGITKVRITNQYTEGQSHVIYVDNIRAEKILSDNKGTSKITSTPNNYMQYRVIFSTTDLNYQPVLQNISFAYKTGYEIRIVDSNTVRLYNNTGETKRMKLDVILGGAAIDLQSGQSSISLAPSLAQTDYADNSNSIWINKLGVGGNLLKLQTNSNDVFVVNSNGDLAMSGDIQVQGGNLSLGSDGGVRYNESTNTIEFSNDGGTTWMKLGAVQTSIVLSAEYAGAVLSGDGTNNIGNMTSDNAGSSSNSMNYYEWVSSEVTLNDYDIRVRFALPSNFEGWGSGGIEFSLATESTNSSNNKVSYYIYEETSASVDGSSENNVSSSAGVWKTTTIAGNTLDECNEAGKVCVVVMKLSSLGDNYVRVGDIKLTYNRSL